MGAVAWAIQQRSVSHPTGSPDDRQKKKKIEEHHPAATFWRNREPPVMAEPEQAGDNEADHQRDHRLRIDVQQVDPVRRALEAAGLRQIVGQQMATPKIVLLSISSRRISKRPICFNLAPPSKPTDTRPGHAFSCSDHGIKRAFKWSHILDPPCAFTQIRGGAVIQLRC
jgi:hypothetical protein